MARKHIPPGTATSTDGHDRQKVPKRRPRFPAAHSLRSLFTQPLGQLLASGTIKRACARVPRNASGPERFERCLEALHLRCCIADEDVARIPKTGPALVVANTPFGGVEPFILGHILSRVRTDFRILGCSLVRRLPLLGEWLIDGAEETGSQADSRAVAAAAAWLRQGGLLVCFPAVPEATGAGPALRRRAAWGQDVAAILRQAKCPALPIHFPGRGSYLFQTVGLLRPTLQSVLIPRGLVHRRRQGIEARVGKVIPWRRLEGLPGDGEVTDYLRVHTCFLKHRAAPHRRSLIPLPPRRRRQEPVADAVPADRLAVEVAALPADRRMVEAGEFEVYCCAAGDIPNLLREIGRLREITFRGVGEGTGKALDLDRFDAHYLHLFLWHKEAHQVAGAYRLGRVDEIRDRFGAKGLYTQTLFHFRRNFLARLGHALELGRSFVRAEYQRRPTALSLLWRGIGEFVVRHPEYRRLIGPVSISRDYRKASKDLIVRFMRQGLTDPELARYIRPRNPYRSGPRKALDRRSIQALVKDIGDVSTLVSGIEKDGRGVPVLLRYYLDLNATLLGFNVDKDFSDTLDGFVLIDLSRTDGRILSRFLGAEGYRSFVAYHGLEPFAPPNGQPASGGKRPS